MNRVNKFSSINIFNDYSNGKEKRIGSSNHNNFRKGKMPTIRNNINNYGYKYRIKKNKIFQYDNSIYGNYKDDILSINSLSITKLMIRNNSNKIIYLICKINLIYNILKGRSKFFLKNNGIQDKKTIKNNKKIINDEYIIKYEKNFDNKKIIKKYNENINKKENINKIKLKYYDIAGNEMIIKKDDEKKNIKNNEEIEINNKKENKIEITKKKDKKNNDDKEDEKIGQNNRKKYKLKTNKKEGQIRKDNKEAQEIMKKEEEKEKIDKKKIEEKRNDNKEEQEIMKKENEKKN